MQPEGKQPECSRTVWCVTQAFIDTVGDADNYSKRLSSRFPGIAFTVCPKADSLYPIVSVASIAAKVTRDRCPTLLDGETGSGYPSDPTCQKWLQDNVDRVFGYPDNARCAAFCDEMRCPRNSDSEDGLN
jgi:ribonuclease H2 subunit A